MYLKEGNAVYFRGHLGHEPIDGGLIDALLSGDFRLIESTASLREGDTAIEFSRYALWWGCDLSIHRDSLYPESGVPVKR